MHLRQKALSVACCFAPEGGAEEILLRLFLDYLCRETAQEDCL